jgi:Glyoxalase superfamily protein/Clp amino terminal domain, pathogenicity island component
LRPFSGFGERIADVKPPFASSERVSNASPWRIWFAHQAKDDPMRDFRDAKTMARTLRTALAAKGLKISNSDSLELIAQAFGVRDWNTLSAMLHAEPAEPPKTAASPPIYADARPVRSGHVGFSANLEETLHRAVVLAKQRNHGYAATEHLLLALTDDQDAAAVLKACNVDINELKAGLVGYLDAGLSSIVVEDEEHPRPTASFQRIVQRAVIHVQRSASGYVTGANVLVAIFSEPESRATGLLLEQKMTRYDAVNFIGYGVAKGGGPAAA